MRISKCFQLWISSVQNAIMKLWKGKLWKSKEDLKENFEIKQHVWWAERQSKPPIWLHMGAAGRLNWHGRGFQQHSAVQNWCMVYIGTVIRRKPCLWHQDKSQKLKCAGQHLGKQSCFGKLGRGQMKLKLSHFSTISKGMFGKKKNAAFAERTPWLLIMGVETFCFRAVQQLVEEETGLNNKLRMQMSRTKSSSWTWKQTGFHSRTRKQSRPQWLAVPSN